VPITAAARDAVVILGGAATTMLNVMDLVVSEAEVIVTVALPPAPVAGAVYVAPVAV
jgi:hypothetical protein